MTSNNSFIKIKNFITEDERSYLLSLTESPDFVQHRSTKSGELSPLNFLPIKFRKFERAWIMKMLPYAVQEMHTDGENLGRNVLIIHPLSNNYAPVITQNGKVNTTAIINTQSYHAVENNEEIRVNLQIPFPYNFEDIQDRSHDFWQIVEELYNV
jgi:hypothetical protein